jgi:hypothetical protein
MTEKYKKLISLKITKLMLDDLKKLAAHDQRSVSDVIRLLLTAAINTRKANGTFPED